MKPNVPSPTDKRPSKPAGELEPGDWVVNNELFDFVEGPIEVVSVTPYTDAVNNDRVLIVLRIPGESAPDTARWLATDKVELATDDEIGRVRTAMRWNAAADALQRVADALRTIHVGDPGVSVDIFPARLLASDEEKIAAVDAVCLAVFGKPGETRENSSDHRPYRQGRGSIGPLYVSVAAQLDAATSEPEGEGTPIRSDESIGRPEDIGRIRAAHEPEGTPVTRYFSFGGGHIDPKTSESLRNKYVTVVAPTAEGCREAILASRFGRAWSMEYIPGRPRTDEWIAQWTEHERIVIDADGGCE